MLCGIFKNFSFLSFIANAIYLALALDSTTLVVLTLFQSLALEELLGLTLIVATPFLLLLPTIVASELLLEFCPLNVKIRFPILCLL